MVLIIFSGVKTLTPLIGTLHESCVPFLRPLTIAYHIIIIMIVVVKVLSYFTKEKLNTHILLCVGRYTHLPFGVNIRKQLCLYNTRFRSKDITYRL